MLAYLVASALLFGGGSLETNPSLVSLGTVFPKVAISTTELKQLQNDSKVVTDLLSSFLKEGTKLLVTGKDYRLGIEKSGLKGDSYTGLKLYNVKTKESISVLGGQDHQRRNVMLRYEFVGSTGSLFKTYTSLTDTLFGKGYTEKNVKPILEASGKLEKATTSAKALGGSWDVNSVYGKTAEGVCHVSLMGNTLFKNMTDQLTGLVKNTDVKFKAQNAFAYELDIVDKASQKIISSLVVDFKTGSLKIASRSDAGLEVFKKVVNVGLKQADPSGKTTYDTVFAKQADLLKEYEKISQSLSAQKAYELVGSTGVKTLVGKDVDALSLLAEKYNLKDQLFKKDGVSALSVKVGLLNGWLYMKDGYLYFVLDFYPA